MNRLLARAARNRERGVTLLEMIVVVALVGILIGITFPSVASGIESLRLRSASDNVVAVLNSALVRADRQQDGIDVTISAHNHSISTQAVRTNAMRRVDLPEGIQISRVLPEIVPGDESANLEDRHFFIYPDGSVPKIVIDLVNRKGRHRLVAVDPITGVAMEQSVAAEGQDTEGSAK